MFNDLINSGPDLKRKLKDLKLTTTKQNLRKMPLSKQYLLKRISFEVGRTLYEQAKEYITTRIEKARVTKTGCSVTLQTTFGGSDHQIKARVYALDNLWICFIVIQPAFGEVALLSGHGPLLGDALFTSVTDLPFPVMAPRTDKRYSIYHDEHLSEPLIWGEDKSHASSNSMKAVDGFRKKHLEAKGELLYIWDSKVNQLV